MLLRTENLLKVLVRPSLFNFYMSSVKLPDPLLKIKKEKAQLAMDCIELISTKPHDLNSMETSLKQRILEVVNTKPQLETETRNYFNSFLRKGVYVDPMIFHQARISLAKSPQTKKLVFYPTYLVTSQVFNQVRDLPQGVNLLSGHFGISKTTSICMLYHLTHIIDEYRFLKGVQVDERMKRIPKILYWSLRNSRNSLDLVKKIILSQCPQLNNKEFIDGIDKFDQKTSLFECYRRIFPEIQTILIIDQIQTLKKYQRMYDEALNKKEQSRSEEQKEQCKMVKEILDSIKFILPNCNKTIYLSSLNPEKESPSKAQLTLDENSKNPFSASIQYSSRIFELQSMMQLVHYFLFEAQERILRKTPFKQFDHQTKKQIISQCFSYLKQKRRDFFVTPLDFRTLIDQQLQLSQDGLRSLKDKTELKRKIISIFQFIIDESVERYSQSLKNHFFKRDGNDSIRKQVMLQLYHQSFINTLVRKNLISSSTDKSTNKRYIDKIPLQHLSFTSSESQKLIDRRLFDFEVIEKKKFVKLLIPPQLIVKVLEPYVRESITLYMRHIKKFLTRASSDKQLGCIIQNLIILIINKGRSNVKFKLYQYEEKQQYSLFKFHFEDPFISGFESLPVKIDKYFFMKRLIGPIKQMVKNRGESALCFPLESIYLNEKLDQITLNNIKETSKIIDLIFIENPTLKPQTTDPIKIWLIDVTISKKQIQPKIIKFLKEYLKWQDRFTNFFDQIKPKVSLNFIVLGPKDSQFNIDVFRKNLPQKITDNFSFEEKPELRQQLFKVTSVQKSSTTLIDKIGCIDMASEVIFEKIDDKNNIEIMEFNAALSAIEQLIKKREEEQKALKK